MASVRPGINDPFQDDTAPDSFFEKFEVEDREIFVHHAKLVALADIKPGSTVLDLGCGTGLFMEELAKAVGEQGLVVCADPAAKFLPLLEARRQKLGLSPDNVTIVQSFDKIIPLNDSSVDRLLLVDVYHHVEFPPDFLRECSRVLKAGGSMFVVDFERIEGVSTEWVLSHVRASREDVFAEILDNGFELIEQLPHVLEVNWVARFRPRT